MKNLTTGIYSKAAGSALMTSIGSRLYKGRAPANATYPYVVYSVVTDMPDVTFTEDYEDVIIQFSLYSSASGTTEIENMYTYLKAVYDECELTITDETLICMKRDNAVFQAEDHTTPSGTAQVWAYYVDYSVYVEV
jgi:hypothetical protein